MYIYTYIFPSILKNRKSYLIFNYGNEKFVLAQRNSDNYEILELLKPRSRAIFFFFFPPSLSSPKRIQTRAKTTPTLSLLSISVSMTRLLHAYRCCLPLPRIVFFAPIQITLLACAPPFSSKPSLSLSLSTALPAEILASLSSRKSVLLDR